jgi:hypothetical protein
MRNNALHTLLTSAFTSSAYAGRLISIVLLATLVGCASVPERTQLPLELTKQGGIPGIPDARYWGDGWPKYNMERLESFTDADLRENFPGIYGKSHDYLAISGGGANGAFGAGLLLGWTATGTRPEFTVVTGVSTGAMTAPFAFLGPDYDDELKTIYTTTSTKDVIEKRNFISSLLGDAINDSRPLKKLIEKYIDDDMIDAIAREHKKG